MGNMIKNKQILITDTFDIGGNRITNLLDPIENSDAVTLQYLTGNTSTSLSGLTDVVITAPTDNQVLTYNGDNWVNGDATGLWEISNSGTTITPIDPDVNLQVNSIIFPDDPGEVTFIDLSVTSGSSQGTAHSYSFDIDGNTIAKIYSESDGDGGVQNTGLVLESDYQYFGDPVANGTWRLYIDSNGDLVIEKRVASVWTYSGKFAS